MEALKRKFLCNTSGSSLVCLKTSHMNVNKNGSIAFVGAENSTELSVYKPGQSSIPHLQYFLNLYKHFMVNSCLIALSMEDGWRNVSNPIKGNRPINIVESGLDQS